MRVPVWLTLAIAILVLGFGAYRIYLATRARPAKAAGGAGGVDDADGADGATAKRRGGMLGSGFYRMSPRTHLLVGIVYIALAGCLIATTFGWSPFGDLIGPSTEKPTKDNAPTKTGVPIDQLPAPKK